MQAWTLGIALFGAVVAMASLTWNIVQFLLRGARPKSHLVVGAIMAGGRGLVTWPLDGDGAAQMRTLAAQGYVPRQVVGAKVVNHGRSPVRVQRWSVIGVGTDLEYTPIADSVGPNLPQDLPAGANGTWVVDLLTVKAALVTTADVLGQETRSIRIVVELGTGKNLVTAGALPITE